MSFSPLARPAAKLEDGVASLGSDASHAAKQDELLGSIEVRSKQHMGL